MRKKRSSLCAAVAALLLTAFSPLAGAAARQIAVPAAQETAQKQATIKAARPAFSAALPRAVNEKAIREVQLRVVSAYDTPRALPVSMQTTIQGEAEATQEQMAAFIERNNPKPKLNCSVAELVRCYYEEGAREGLRGDIALCQALKETGFFAYGGDVLPGQNNFCGLGATGGGARGAQFATPQIGVRAHIQHLKAYASAAAPAAPLVDPRYTHVRTYRPDVFGKITEWRGLNGVWAVPGREYGEQILALWQEAMRPDASDVSLAAAEERLRRAPDDPASYRYRGSVYYERGDYTKALADFQKAASGKAPSADALFDLALAEEKTGSAAKAQKTYARLVKDAPRDEGARYNRARLLLAAKEYGAAIKELSAMPKDSSDAQNALAAAYIGKRDYKRAWNALARAAELAPASMDILANQFIFEACLKRP